MERWFIWLNAELDLIKEQVKQFVVVGDTSSLIGSDVFMEILLKCPSDVVAAMAVKFLTLLPQHFSAEMTATGATADFRKSMLDKCMRELEQLHVRNNQSKLIDNGVTESTTPSRMARILLFLEGILEVITIIESSILTLLYFHRAGIPIAIRISNCAPWNNRHRKHHHIQCHIN